LRYNGREEALVTTSTSFRLSGLAKHRLSDRADREGISATALLERLIVEGVEQLDHPGIIFRGPPQDRRAALAAGPDVWEIVSRLQELDGAEEDRIATLAAESDLSSRLVRIALDYASLNPDSIRERIERNRALIDQSRRAAAQRANLLAS
jgi:sarcosine oxidase gamma subunit